MNERLQREGRAWRKRQDAKAAELHAEYVRVMGPEPARKPDTGLTDAYRQIRYAARL